MEETKKTDVFDKLDNVIGNYQDGKADFIHVFKAAIKVNQYLSEHPHPHDCHVSTCNHPRDKRTYIGQGYFRCACGHEFK